MRGSLYFKCIQCIPHFRLLIAGGVVMMALAWFGSYLFTDELREGERQRGQLERQVMLLQKAIHEAEQVIASTKHHQSERGIQASFFTDDLSELVVIINRLASRHHIIINQLDWQDAIQYNTYIQFPFSLVLTGETPGLMAFFRQVSTLLPGVTFYNLRWQRTSGKLKRVQVITEGAVNRLKQGEKYE